MLGLDRFFTSDYELGQRVIHTLTGHRGRIVDKQKQRGLSLISVDLDNGVKIKLEDRRLFQGCSKG